MFKRFFFFLKRKYRESSRCLRKINLERVYSVAVVTVLVFFAISSISTKAKPEHTEVYDKSVVVASTTTCESTTMVKTEKATTLTATIKSTTTMTSTAITELTTSNATTTTSTGTATSTAIVTTTESQTTYDENLEVEWEDEFYDTNTASIYSMEENTAELEPTISGVGQYGYNIDPSEYDVLAQVMAHEGEYCDVAVRERIGICFLNRFCNSGFGSPSTLWEIKNAPYQYFCGYYSYGDETAELAKNLIAVYNSGSEYWAVFCAERNLTSLTVYQRNDYVVEGTNYVYDEIVYTIGGYSAHLYYSS